MTCPFRFRLEKKTVPRLDETGFHADEHTWDVVPLECTRDACMVFDAAAGVCSLARTSDRTAGLVEQLPGQIRAGIDQSLFDRAEMLSVLLATNFDHLQTANRHFAENVTAQLEQLVRALKESGERTGDRNQDLARALGKIESLFEEQARRANRLERALIDVVDYLAKLKKGRP